MPEILTLDGNTYNNEIFKFGDISVKSASTKDLILEGYVSTKTADLVDDIVDPESFRKWLPRYKANPLFCFNHVKEFPIGLVRNPSIDSKGLFLDGIKMEGIKGSEYEVPMVVDYIEPMTRAGVLKQMSIGFFGLKGAQRGENYIWQEVYLYESSLVSVACNPEAVAAIKCIAGKKFPIYGDIKSFMADVNKGLITLDKSFTIMNNPIFKSNDMPTMETGYNCKSCGQQMYKSAESTDMSCANSSCEAYAQPVELPAISDASADADCDDMGKSLKYDPTGETITAPRRNEENYKSVMHHICLAKKISDSGEEEYFYKIGSATKDGYKFSEKDLAINTVRVCGARGGEKLTEEERKSLFVKLKDTYIKLGMQLPVFDGKSLFDITDVKSIKFSDIVFYNNEKEIYKMNQLDTDLENVLATIKGMSEVPDEIKVVVKDIYASAGLNFYADMSDGEDLAFMTAVIALVDSYNKREVADSGTFKDLSSRLKDLSTYFDHMSSNYEQETTEEGIKQNEVTNQFLAALRLWAHNS